MPEPFSISFWLGDGRGNWVKQYKIPVRGDIRSIATGDINNDGFTDIVFTMWGDNGGIRVWLNQGNNKWDEGACIANHSRFEGVTLYDINNDGNLDIIAAN